jgi:hypothetical protein
VPHAFSTRIGGVSAGPFESLNLGNPSDHSEQDSTDNIAENYRRLTRSIGCEDRTRCFVHQVHGDQVIRAEAGGQVEHGRCADAIVSDDPAKLLSIRTADCVPILLATDDGRRVAAVHAGWRGVVAEIVPRAIEALHDLSGFVQAPLLAAIGPCIGFDAFEVGPEVLTEFDAAFGFDVASSFTSRTPGGKGHIDLRRAIESQLVRSGIARDAIDITDRCTLTHSDEFFSHRRDRGLTGRMAALIGARR